MMHLSIETYEAMVKAGIIPTAEGEGPCIFADAPTPCPDGEHDFCFPADKRPDFVGFAYGTCTKCGRWKNERRGF